MLTEKSCKKHGQYSKTKPDIFKHCEIYSPSPEVPEERVDNREGYLCLLTYNYVEMCFQFCVPSTEFMPTSVKHFVHSGFNNNFLVRFVLIENFPK